jgi:hypothetical protein
LLPTLTSKQKLEVGTVQIIIEGYLTETKLATALRELVGNLWVGGQVQLPGSRRTWDMAFRQNGSLVLAEYDGDDHYRDSLKIKSDRERDRLAQESGIRVVRVPYWVQLDSVTVQYYFGISAEIRQNFPHGFITTKLFPASFCELGVERFKHDLQALPPQVRSAVIRSLRERVEQYGMEYVLPSTLTELAFGSMQL